MNDLLCILTVDTVVSFNVGMIIYYFHSHSFSLSLIKIIRLYQTIPENSDGYNVLAPLINVSLQKYSPYQ